MRSPSEIGTQLAWSADRGLASEAVLRSRQLFGPNQLSPPPRESAWRKFLGKFDEPIIKILLAAALLSMTVDLFKAEPLLGGLAVGIVAVLAAGALVLRRAHWIPVLLFAAAVLLFLVGIVHGHVLAEGLAVMIAVILATGVAFLSEYKSDREFELLNATKESLQAKVLRDGLVRTAPLEEIVVGDVVLLEMGDEISADGRLLRATELYVDQSLMTGESEPQRKFVQEAAQGGEGPEQPDCLYRGTQVVDGVGAMLVTEVGDETYLGQIARTLSSRHTPCAVAEVETAGPLQDGTRSVPTTSRVRHKLTIDMNLTPLQIKLKRLAELISRIGYGAAALIFLAQLVRGIQVGEIYVPHDWTHATNVFGELLGYFVIMVVIIVVAVPEGLPMSVTVSLALAMRKMSRAHCLVRQLVACETIGSATVICSDKTGTLTRNQMRVEMAVVGESLHEPENGLPEWIALNAAVNSTANLEMKEGKLVPIGNSTEGALLLWLREAGIDYGRLRGEFAPLYQMHFSSERKRMTAVVASGPHRARLDSELLVLVKGSPEWVLEHCRHLHAADGSRQLLGDEAKATIQRLIDNAGCRAMRTLAFAIGTLPPGTPGDQQALHHVRDSLETDLIYAGFVAIRDPLRDDVKDALAECRRAGIAVKIVTGDNVETARAIGCEIGLIEHPDEPIDVPGAAVLTSPRFQQLSDEELQRDLPGLRILARARPLDKLRLVRLLQEMGEVVAVTGDGTNDAPALKQADVGLAMGIAGTEVAKEASKIVLLDDAFSTIVKAVRWGRSLSENIQRFLQFQLTINLSALTITFLGILLFHVKAPFTVLQLLWINVIMDTLASIALCSEPARREVMDRPPTRRDDSILTGRMLKTIFTTGGFFVVVMLSLLLLMKGDPHAPGLLAGGGPWSVELAGSRVAVAAAELEPRAGKWYFHGDEVAVDFTVYQVSLFFSVYVFFQVWNQINCRSLRPDRSGLSGLGRNTAFVTVALIVAVGQILIVTFGGNVFKVEPLEPLAWLGVIGFTASVLLFAEVVRRVSWK